MLKSDHVVCRQICRIGLLLLAGGLLTLAGCSEGLPRGGVKGQVTVDGKPLEKGRILFTPVAPTQGPAVSAMINHGQYELVRSEGPVAGSNRVEVEAELDLGFAMDDEAAYAKRGGKPLPKNPIPPKYNRNSTLVAPIAEGDNVYDVQVATK